MNSICLKLELKFIINDHPTYPTGRGPWPLISRMEPLYNDNIFLYFVKYGEFDKNVFYLSRDNK